MILAYHKVDDRPEWGITRTTRRQFERQMKFLYESGYQTISLESYLNSLLGFEIIPDRWVIITFDDSYESVYRGALPILDRFGFKATVFVIAGYVGRDNRWDANVGWRRFNHLKWAQMREMRDCGYSFQSHTVNHPDLTKLKTAQLKYELSVSKQIIEDSLGTPVKYISYPFDRFDFRVFKVAEDVGYRAGFSLRWTDESDIFAVGRQGVYLVDSLWDFRHKVEKGRWFWLERAKGRVINSFARGTTVVKGNPDYELLE